MALTVRPFIGTVILPNGEPVLSGTLYVRPTGTVPADVEEMLTDIGTKFAIVNGAVSGNLVAPCNYRFSIKRR